LGADANACAQQQQQQRQQVLSKCVIVLGISMHTGHSAHIRAFFVLTQQQQQQQPEAINR
jgi:hypothetical protein